MSRAHASRRNPFARMAFTSLLLTTALAVGESSAAERVSHSTRGRVETWRIEQPTVTRSTTTYRQIRFGANDEVRIRAGGCVRVGKKSWKRYVDPQGSGNGNRHHGLVGVSDDNGIKMVPLKGVIGNRYRRGAGFASGEEPVFPAALTLGYDDSKYSDNGYGRRLPTEGQCKDEKPAWVTVEIRRARPPFSLSKWDWDEESGMLHYAIKNGSPETMFCVEVEFPLFGSADAPLGHYVTATFNIPAHDSVAEDLAPRILAPGVRRVGRPVLSPECDSESYPFVRQNRTTRDHRRNVH